MPNCLPSSSSPSTLDPEASTFTTMFVDHPRAWFGVIIPDTPGLNNSGPRSPTI